MLVALLAPGKRAQDRAMTEHPKTASRTGCGHRHPGRPAAAPIQLTWLVRPRWAGLMLCLSVMTSAVYPSTAFAVADVPAPAANRLWGGCQLSTNAVNEILGKTGAADFILVYSFSTNDGQPVGTQTPPPHTGPIVCTAPNTQITAYTESTPLPNRDTGGNTIDILNTEQAEIVHHSRGGAVEKRICRSVGGNTDCRTVTLGSGQSCRLTPPIYDAIVAAIGSGTGIVDAGVSFAFITAHSVDGFAGGSVCAAPNYQAVSSGDAIPAGIDILGTEESLILRYQINGGKRNGETEKRLCHTVADKTDSFRLFK
jgi:hypothetical protein